MKIWQKLIPVTIFITLLLVTGCASGISENSFVGKKAPDFAAVGLDNTLVDLGDYQGKPLILNFWAIRCPYCVAEMPFLQQIHDEYSTQGLVVLGINSGESLGNVKPFIENNGYTYTVLLDTSGAAADKYGVYYIPATYFIDKEGIILDVVIASFQSKAEIEKYLVKIMK